MPLIITLSWANETIKYFRILPHDFSVETGELTPTMKVKRRFVNEKYKQIIDLMYNIRQ